MAYIWKTPVVYIWAFSQGLICRIPLYLQYSSGPILAEFNLYLGCVAVAHKGRCEGNHLSPPMTSSLIQSWSQVYHTEFTCKDVGI